MYSLGAFFPSSHFFEGINIIWDDKFVHVDVLYFEGHFVFSQPDFSHFLPEFLKKNEFNSMLCLIGHVN